jgi:hypothetical protein
MAQAVKPCLALIVSRRPCFLGPVVALGTESLLFSGHYDVHDHEDR